MRINVEWKRTTDKIRPLHQVFDSWFALGNWFEKFSKTDQSGECLGLRVWVENE